MLVGSTYRSYLVDDSWGVVAFTDMVSSLRGGHFAIGRVQEAEGNNFMDARTSCLFQI